MGTGFFGNIEKIPFKGADSTDPLSYRFYDPEEVVMGKRMEDHLRFAVAYWHSFAWEGGDPFGGRTFDRPWYDGEMDKAKMKADVAFEMFDLLGVPFFCFHDRDAVPEGATHLTSERDTVFGRRTGIGTQAVKTCTPLVTPLSTQQGTRCLHALLS